MTDNVTTPRFVRLQHALTGKPLAERTKAELEEIAADAWVETGGTADELRQAIRDTMRRVVTAGPRPRTTLAGLNFASDEAAEAAAHLSADAVGRLRDITPSGAGGITVADVKAARTTEEE